MEGKVLLNSTNLLSPNEYEKNDEIRLEYLQKHKTKKLFYENYFKRLEDEKKCISLSILNIENVKTMNFVFDKALVFSLICYKCSDKDEKIFLRNNQT